MITDLIMKIAQQIIRRTLSICYAVTRDSLTALFVEQEPPRVQESTGSRRSPQH